MEIKTLYNIYTKQMPRPTWEKVQRDMAHFDFELQMYAYHFLNERYTEAATYLQSYYDKLECIRDELKPLATLENE